MAHQIAIAALSFSFLSGMGFGIAATALVGQSLGARRMDEGAAATRIATRWEVSWMSAIGAIVLIFAQPIMQLFTVDPAVIEVRAAGLRIVALAQPFWAALANVGGGLIAVWVAFLALVPAQTLIYRWRWRLAVREYRG